MQLPKDAETADAGARDEEPDPAAEDKELVECRRAAASRFFGGMAVPAPELGREENPTEQAGSSEPPGGDDQSSE